MSTDNRFFDTGFSAVPGSLANPRPLTADLAAVEGGFKKVQDELDALGTITPSKLTNLTDFPSGYAGHAYQLLRVRGDETGVEFVRGGKMRIKAIGGTAYTLELADFNSTNGTLLIFTSNSPVLVTVPKNLLVDADAGEIIMLAQHGNGQVVIAGADNDVLLYSAAAMLKTRAKFSQIALCRFAANAWTVIGDRSA